LAWCSGNANGVALHRAELALGRVTAYGQVGLNYLGMKPAA